MKILAILGVTMSLFFGGAANAADTPDIDHILQITDLVRGGGTPGIEWNLKITSSEPEKDDRVVDLIVRAAGDDSLAETVAPARSAGTRLLQLGQNMWYANRNIQKAVSISSRQKMTGQAANGDIAATNYVKDYDAVFLREDSFDGEAVYVLDLTAKNRFVTYDRIIYWVSRERLVPVKAEFYTVSGKLFKTAVFETGNVLKNGENQNPFISRMTIRDAINTSNYSVLEYSSPKLQRFSKDVFSVALLTR